MTTKTHRTGGSRGGNQYGSYQVRYATQSQVDYIKKLLNRKQHNLVVDFATLNVQGAGEIIKNLLQLPDIVGFVDYATDKQVKYAKSLISSKQNGLDVLNHRLQQFNLKEIEKMDKTQISILISDLRVKEDIKPTISEVGAYLYEGVVYSIRKNQVGRLILWTYNPERKSYERNYPATKNLLHKIQPENRLTLELAVKYSAQIGICVHCGKSLTVLKSIAGGIGPVCAKKYK